MIGIPMLIPTKNTWLSQKMHPIGVKLKKPEFWSKIWQGIKVVTFLSFPLFRCILRENVRVINESAQKDGSLDTQHALFHQKKMLLLLSTFFPNLRTFTDLRK